MHTGRREQEAREVVRVGKIFGRAPCRSRLANRIAGGHLDSRSGGQAP